MLAALSGVGNVSNASSGSSGGSRNSSIGGYKSQRVNNESVFLITVLVCCVIADVIYKQ